MLADGTPKRQYRLDHVRAFGVGSGMEHIGSFLRNARQEAGLSQEELAGKLGVRQQTVSEVESRKDVMVSTVERFLGACDYRMVLEATPQYP